MKIAIIGNPGYVKQSFLKSAEDVFKEVGLNTGNLAFWYAVNSHIENEKTYFNWEFDPDYLNKVFDRVFFIAANQLNPDWDMSYLAGKFLQLKIPLIVIGLGAQAEFNQDVYKQQDGTIKFMEAISEKSTHISVRGPLTKSVLEKHGIHNVKITGCPSNFINPKLDIAKLSNPKNCLNKNLKNIIFNIDIVPKLRNFLPLISDWSKGLDDFIFVSQAPLNIIEAARSDDIYKKTELLTNIRDLVFPGSTLKYTASFVNRSFKAYFNAEMWLEDLLHYDFSIGSRMHGNMLAFQIGVPTVFIAHDERVLEMFQTMKLPYLMLEDAVKYKNLNSIINHVVYDEDEYRNTRKKLCNEYIDIMKDNDITVNNELKIIGSPN